MLLDTGVLIQEILPLLVIFARHEVVLLLSNKRLVIQLFFKVLLIRSIVIWTL
jgi:hypothetical protein